MTRALVTGRMGFIGSHIVGGLIEHGHSVCVFYNLDSQVHGDAEIMPDY